jgi:hypothetical protein
MDGTSPADAIKTTIFEFITDLRDCVFTKPQDRPAFVKMEFFFNLMSSDAIASHVVKYVLPYKPKIRAKDMVFFMEQKQNIFVGMPENIVNHFAEIVQTPEEQGGITEENLNVIWQYFDTLVTLAEKHSRKK